MILRPATPEDAPALAAILHECFRVSLPYLPQLHTVEENEGFIRNVLAPQHEIWVADVDGVAMGYVAFRPGRVQHLYIHPDAQQRGIGPRLLAKALESGEPKDLWTFQANARARRFYEARGFEAVEFTDGADNEERMPDVRYVWRPTPD